MQRSTARTAFDVLSAEYTIRAQWDVAYVVDVRVIVSCDQFRNPGCGMRGWRIDFHLDKSTKVRKLWNATFTRDGNTCSAVHTDFCAPVEGSAKKHVVLCFGFEASRNHSNDPVPEPPFLVVNGEVCGVATNHARNLADCCFDELLALSASGSDRDLSPRNLSPSRTPSPSSQSDVDSSSTLQDEDAIGAASDSMSPTIPYVEALQMLGDEDLDSMSETPEKPRTASNEASSSHAASLQSSTTDLWNSLTRDGLRKRKAVESNLFMRSSSASPCEIPQTLPLEYYHRSKRLKQRKRLHVEHLDACAESREEHILRTVFSSDVERNGNDAEEQNGNSCPGGRTVMEPNMFPYDTPPGVSHWTLWSKDALTADEISRFVNEWLRDNMASATEWNHDNNMQDGLSINLFHVHVYIREGSKTRGLTDEAVSRPE